MSPFLFVSLCIVCFVLCTTIMRVVLNTSVSLKPLDGKDGLNAYEFCYYLMLTLCYIIFISFGVFVIATNLPAVLVFLSFALLWKSLDIKEYCLNSIVSYIKEKMKEE